MKKFLLAAFLIALITTATVAYGHVERRHGHREKHVAHRASTDSGDIDRAVYDAAGNGDVSRLRNLFARGGHADGGDANLGLSSPLEWAASKGHPAAVRFLIAHGAYVDSENNGGETPLDDTERAEHFTTDFALRARLLTVIAILVHAGAGAEDRAVTKAASEGDAALLQKLIAEGKQGDFERSNPLILAVAGAHLAVVRVLLTPPWSVGLTDTDANGATALDIAELKEKQVSDPEVHAKYADIVALLQKDWALEQWQSAVLLAVSNDDVAQLQVLFAHGETPNFVSVDDNSVSTPLMMAAEGESVNAVRFLLSLGANVNAKDDSGDTALGNAEYSAKQEPDSEHRKYAEIIRMLKNAGGRHGH